ncbi:MAG TPA: hypothetical protein VL240_03820 [Candidatus Binatia bacterium]|nr:hypothetical protein [Candidatus Binatia bacterium]
MHFIEQIFHVVPDGGTGVLELGIVLVLLTLPLAGSVLRRKRASRERSR